MQSMARHPLFGRLKRIVEGANWLMEKPASKLFFVLCIVANALVITLQVEYGLGQSIIRIQNNDLEMAQQIFALIFSIEIIVRFAAKRSNFFNKDEREWNLFDVLVMLMDALDYLFNVFGTATVLRIIRLFRVLRLLRHSLFFRELRTMTLMILVSFESLVWVFVLVIVIIYIFSVMVASAIGVLIRSEEVESVQELSNRGLSEMYSSIPVIMLTLLLSAFGGMDWKDSLEPLMPLHHSWFYVIGFIAYEGFMLLGLINTPHDTNKKSALVTDGLNFHQKMLVGL